jgi:hypothetical protein
VAGPVAPVDPVLPEPPDVAPEPVMQTSPRHGERLRAGPVLPDLPEPPESPEVAELRLLLADPVLPELAFPDLAVVVLAAVESALPLFPP